jgi:hypothetical protein
MSQATCCAMYVFVYLFFQLFPDPYHQIKKCRQADEDSDCRVDSVEDGGGSGSSGADDGWL